MDGGHGGGMEVMETKKIPFLTTFLIHKLSQGKSLKVEEEESKKKISSFSLLNLWFASFHSVKNFSQYFI